MSTSPIERRVVTLEQALVELAQAQAADRGGGGLVCLSHGEEGWRLAWALTAELVRD